MISVCMATYNGERYIRCQIESILTQLDCCDELVVSDDGSTDRTLKIISEIGDNRIRVLRHIPNGIAHNFEYVVENAHGEYIFFSDQDDVWRSDKIKKCMEAFNRDADLVMHNACIVDAAGNRMMRKTLFDIKHSRPGFWTNITRNTYVGCCMAIRRSLVEKVLPFPQRINMHDEWIGLIASVLGAKQVFLSDTLIDYRQHGGNATQSVSKSGTTFAWKLKKRCLHASLCVSRVIKLKTGAK